MPPTQPTSQSGMDPSPLLERADQLAALETYLASILRGAGGRIVLVGSEAGGGKSALVQRFCEDSARAARVLVGACDPLFTPRPLGPLLDIAPAVGGEFRAFVERGARPYEIATALLRTLSAGALSAETPTILTPTILVFEDVHWADEATLDVILFLARRIESIPALILVTYRDDVDRSHPLRLLLGELSQGKITARLRLAPLSPHAVAELAEPTGADATELFRMTAGNPFFVTEALAAGEVEIPPTVRDAVLARIARLPTGALDLLEAVAIVPQQTESWLLERLAGAALVHLDACLVSGILEPAGDAIRFRHEMARLAVEGELTPIYRTELHRRALHALERPPTGEPDLARLVHHAEAAADSDALLRFAPAAAAHASTVGAHREAAAHYARALRVASGLDPIARGDLFRHHAHECFLNDQFPAALVSERNAAECFRLAGDRLQEGDAQRTVSHYLRCGGHPDEGLKVAMQAVALLEQLPPGRELALAYAQAAMIYMNATDAVGTEAFGQRAYALAQEVGDVEALVHVLNTLGTMELVQGAPEGQAKLQRSLELARAAAMEEHVGRAYLNLCEALIDTRAYADFERIFSDGVEYCTEHGLVLWRHYLLASGARYALDRGRWSDASDLAQQVVRDARVALPRVSALVVLALIRARRGDPEYWPLLDEAHSLAESTRELQYLAPVAAARAEVAWLEGQPARVREATSDALALAIQHRLSWPIGELACWRFRAGGAASPEDAADAAGAAEPYAREMRGEREAAARYWERLGCSYQAALARAGADDEAALRNALAALRHLGAHATARVVARRLRELGARDLPRGPRPSTRSNDAQLTAREIEVLEVLVQGLRNADIAARLHLAPKTVDHHISAIFAKLGVYSRAEAIAQAFAQRLVPAAPPRRHDTPRA